MAIPCSCPSIYPSCSINCLMRSICILDIFCWIWCFISATLDSNFLSISCLIWFGMLISMSLGMLISRSFSRSRTSCSMSTSLGGSGLFVLAYLRRFLSSSISIGTSLFSFFACTLGYWSPLFIIWAVCILSSLNLSLNDSWAALAFLSDGARTDDECFERDGPTALGYIDTLGRSPTTNDFPCLSGLGSYAGGAIRLDGPAADFRATLDELEAAGAWSLRVLMLAMDWFCSSMTDCDIYD